MEAFGMASIMFLAFAIVVFVENTVLNAKDETGSSGETSYFVAQK